MFFVYKLDFIFKVEDLWLEGLLYEAKKLLIAILAGFVDYDYQKYTLLQWGTKSIFDDKIKIYLASTIFNVSVNTKIFLKFQFLRA